MKKKIIILSVIESFTGGAFYSLTRIHKFLCNEFSFIVLHGMRKETPSNFKDFFSPDTEFVYWNTSRHISLKADVKALVQLRKIKLKYKPDIIHAHSSKAGALCRIAFPLGNPPIIYSPRAYSFLQSSEPNYKRIAYWCIERLLGCLPHVTVACGQTEYRYARQLSYKPRYIPNALDVAEINNFAVQAKKAEIFQVVSSGRITPQKNFILFLRIARRLQNHEISFLWIGGEIPSELSDDIPKNLIVIPWLPQFLTFSKLAQSHVYMQTSLWEGLSRSVLEAMAIGLPILTLPTPGNRDLVIDGLNGHICETEDEFCKIILMLKNNADKVNQLSEESKRIAIDEHDEKKSINYGKIYIMNF